MGEVVFWTIARIVIVIPSLWVLRNYVGYDLWITISIFAIYGAVIHPAITQLRLFGEKNRDIIEDSLCSNCEHFNKSAVLCVKLDKHPAKNYIPCDGIDWIPKSIMDEEKDVFNE